MKEKPFSVLILFFGPLFLWAGACVDSSNADLEEARFLLDQGLYSQAADKAEKVLQAHPNHVEAKLVYADVLLGEAALSSHARCRAEDTGFLGLIACLQDNTSSDETAFSTFLRVAPDSVDQVEQIETAANHLKELRDTPGLEETKRMDVYLQLFFARLFELAGALTRIHANQSNSVCNTNESNPLKDRVPDGFDATLLKPEQEDRFFENLRLVGSDGENAGLPEGFGLSSRVAEIVNDVSLVGNVLSTFFDLQFNSPDKAICDQPK